MGTMLIEAAYQGQEGCADLLIRKGANLNIRDKVCSIKVISINNLLLIVLVVALSIYL